MSPGRRPRSGCSASRSSASCTRCRTSSLIRPWLRSSTTALRSAASASAAQAAERGASRPRSGGTRDLRASARSAAPAAARRGGGTRSISWGWMIDVSSISVRRLTAASLACSSASRSSRRSAPSSLSQRPDDRRQRQPLHAPASRGSPRTRRRRRRARCGNGSPLGSVSGSASASASDTMPRIPVQPMSATACQGGFGIARAQPAAQQARQVGPDRDVDQPRHDRDAADRGRVARSATAMTMPVVSARIDASCSPIRMNTRPLNSSSRTLQTPSPAEARQRRQQLAGCASRGSRPPRPSPARPRRPGARPECTPRTASAA